MAKRRPSVRVCPQPGCPELQPCPTHARPKNASWSRDRDRGQQNGFRQRVLARDNWTCTRCAFHSPTGKDLIAHHVKPGYSTHCGQTLCTTCHREIDTNAR